MPGSAGERFGREQGSDIGGEGPFQGLTLDRRERVPAAHRHPARDQIVARQLAEADIRSRHQRMEPDRDRIELFGDGEAVGRAPGNALRRLVLQGPDLDHEELIDVTGENGQKAQPRA